LRRALHAGLGLAALCLALACGGGGGGGDDLATISEANAEDLAGEVLLGLEWSAALGAFGGDIGGGELEATDAGGGISIQAVIGPITEPCPGGGSETVSANVQAPPALASGDAFQVEFDACELEDGATAEGFLSFVVAQLIGDIDTESFAFQLALTLVDLGVSQGDATLVYDGITTLIVDTRDPPFSKNSVSGAGLDILGEGPGLGDGLGLLLEGFTTNASEDIGIGAGVETLSGTGAVEGAVLDDAGDETPIGLVSYESETPFERDGTADYDAGALLISGAGDATIRVVAGGSTATLEIDLDGDGTVDATQVRTWDELRTFE
jgi:hypothetical protein